MCPFSKNICRFRPRRLLMGVFCHSPTSLFLIIGTLFTWYRKKIDWILLCWFDFICIAKNNGFKENRQISPQGLVNGRNLSFANLVILNNWSIVHLKSVKNYFQVQMTSVVNNFIGPVIEIFLPQIPVRSLLRDMNDVVATWDERSMVVKLLCNTRFAWVK